jgi:cytochrome P450
VPERWLGDPKYADDARAVLQPFATGPRNCIGKKYVLPALFVFPPPPVSLTKIPSLAYAEMRLLLARLIWNFDLELMPESRTWNDQKVFTLWQKGEINVKLSPVSRG